MARISTHVLDIAKGGRRRDVGWICIAEGW